MGTESVNLGCVSRDPLADRTADDSTGTVLQMSASTLRRWPLVITFEGPDGSGKSTLADGLRRWLLEEGIDVRTARSRPRTTERLRTTAYDHQNPHDQPVRGSLESIGRVVAKYCFYLTRWSQEAKPTRQPTVLIRERGWLDYLVDGKRYGLSPITAPLVSVLGRFFPRSDYSVVLVGEPSVIHERKPDLPVAEIQRLMTEWKTAAFKTAREVLIIDTSTNSPEESLAVLLAAVVPATIEPRR